MGKNQHSKDKLYIIPSEFARDWGGYKKNAERLPFRCLPFYCCGLSLLPFDEPLATTGGNVFEAKYILPFIAQHGRNPVTGEAMRVTDLYPLKFHKNEEGQYHCPITLKVFTDHSHIVANRKSGHVYSAEAIDNLCKRPQNWKDLLTDELFDPAVDILTIQNPLNSEHRRIDEFHFMQHGLGATGDGSPEFAPSVDLRGKEAILLEAKQRAEARLSHLSSVLPKDQMKLEAGKRSTLYSTGEMSMSFTSTVAAPTDRSQFRFLTSEEERQQVYRGVRRMKDKGYARISTSMGDINIQLHCDLVPETCDNFLQLARQGYYNGTVFHRVIANFMAQGGDPTGTGRGGKSAFEGGESFKDEYHPKLRFFWGGVLAMANNGKNSNRSQFFITFKSAEHLNNRHTIFGRVVGGMDVVKEMEKLEVDERDRPRNAPSIQSVSVFHDPIEAFRNLQPSSDADLAAVATSTDDHVEGVVGGDAAASIERELSKKRAANNPCMTPSKPKRNKMTFDAW